jgi:hypothetical protein
MEVQWLEVTRTDFAGITAKSDPGCHGEYARGTFTQYNTRLHHNYIHHTGSEGFYVGHYSYYGYTDHNCSPTMSRCGWAPRSTSTMWPPPTARAVR